MAFVTLSVLTGYSMGIVISSVYDRITALAFTLVKNSSLIASQHFFAAEQDILYDATMITMFTSLVIYLVIGLQISRYMTSMIFVFSRAIEEDRFPVQLRLTDVYHGLATVLNRARDRMR